MFSVDETVLYGAHGVCRISDISEMDMTGSRVKYYILKPIYDQRSTLFVPVGNEALTSKMRRVMSEDEVYALIGSISGRDCSWIEDEDERKQRCAEVLTSGDRAELMCMIKALYLRQKQQRELGKKLHVADERFLKDAERLLYEEFAHVLNMKCSQVLPFIIDRIGDGDE